MKAKLWLTAAMLLGLALPATADGILSQMENEVAAIAQRAKSAVVTIEDSRALMVSYDTSPLEKADIANRIAHLQIEKQRQTQRLAVLESQFHAGVATAVPVAEARDQVERVTFQLAAEQRKLEQFGHTTEQQRQLQDVDDALALLSIDRHNADTAVAIQQARYKNGLTTFLDLDEARTKLADIDQEIRAQSARRDLLRQAAQDKPQANGALWKLQQAATAANAPRSGTGFSIGDGYIVTTADVLEDMQNPVVITDAGTRIRARVVAMDVELNVGLVKLAALAEIPALQLGDSTRVMPGHFAISIGNQHGDNNAIALNLIAGIRTEATDTGKHFYPSLIQIGGTVGAGTSGAPLLDSRGDVIGIMAGVPRAEPDTPTLYYTATQQLLNVYRTPPGFTFSPATNPIRWQSQSHAATQKANNSGLAAKPQRQLHVAAGKSTVGQRRQGKAGSHPLRTPPMPVRTARNRGVRAANIDFAARLAAPTWSNVAYTWAGNTGYAPMVTAQPTPVVTSAGFAIPISEVRSVLADMKAGKPVDHAWIGVDLENQERGAEKDGIITILRSVKVKSVYAGAPANRAGVLPGDILVSLNGQSLHTIGDVRSGIVKTGTGTVLKLAVERNGAAQTFDVTVEARPTLIGAVIAWPPPPPAPPRAVQKSRQK